MAVEGPEGQGDKMRRSTRCLSRQTFRFRWMAGLDCKGLPLRVRMRAQVIGL